MSIHGVLPVLKPVNYTSHDVVAVLRRILGMKRIGHTGTLDPMVSGVLPICIGKATRMVEYMQELPKQYKAVLQIGLASDTEDASGQIIDSAEHITVTEQQLKDVFNRFTGQIEQIPPMYSAVKVKGKRLYELARQGLEIERRPRQVTIHRIEILDMLLNQPLPEITFQVTCSKGTYIRTLCVDIGRSLGYPALMKHLVRTATGNIELKSCLTLEQVEQLKQENKLHEKIIPVDQAVPHLPAYIIEEPYVLKSLQGQKISLSHISPSDMLSSQANQSNQSNQSNLTDHCGLIRLYSPSQYFLGIYEQDKPNNILKAVKVFGDTQQVQKIGR